MKKDLQQIIGLVLATMYVGFAIGLYLFEVREPACVEDSQELVMADFFTDQFAIGVAVLDKYCLREAADLAPLSVAVFKEKKSLVGFDFRERSLKWREAMLKKTEDKVLEKFDEVEEFEKKGDLFFVAGLWYGQREDFDLMWDYWTCGGEQFYDARSMLKMAMVYGHGVEGLEVERSDELSYFWLQNALYVDALQGEPAAIRDYGKELLELLEAREFDKEAVRELHYEYVEAVYDQH